MIIYPSGYDDDDDDPKSSYEYSICKHENNLRPPPLIDSIDTSHTTVKILSPLLLKQNL